MAGLLVGCTSPPQRAVSVAIQPMSSLADQAVRIQITGLGAGELGMGLIWSMRALKPDPAGAYYWSGPVPRAFTLAVSVHGTQAASASFQRRFSPGVVTETTDSLKADGFVGEFLRPAHTGPGRPAVLVLGGSEGGLPGALLPGLLASNGYAALGVAYFREPGLPQTLSGIPLEYFAQALRWLGRQPGVDPARIAVLGISRGSEAAQLLGAYYPNLVHAVIASVPSNVAGCSYPGCTGPAWTRHGRALPYTSEIGSPSPTDDPAAVIPDQRIAGPVFLDCGEADRTWPSCRYARAIISLLNAHHDHWAHVLYAYPGAGHPVGTFVPYEPYSLAAMAGDPGYATDQRALALLWPQLLSFLAGLAGHPTG
ncbi:MAG: acyl-CoA thioester hydrolase/BAAT C-terminal domain-containing protein [Streptosporangiaceae bacterium]